MATRTRKKTPTTATHEFTISWTVRHVNPKVTEGTAMPKGTKVHKMYEALKREGHSTASAVKIAQAKTGKALATGKKPKGKR